MAQHTGIVTSYDLPNFVGELFTAGIVPGMGEVTPSFLSLIGGLNGANSRIVPDMEFNMTVEFDYPTATQPAISETTASSQLPQPINPIYAPKRNTCQIFQEAVQETYVAKGTRSRLVTDVVYSRSGVNEGWLSEFSPSHNPSPIGKQIVYAIERTHRNVNETYLNGVYQLATGAGVAHKTGGIIPGITTNTVDAQTAPLGDKLFGQLVQKMVTNSGGKAFHNIPVLLMNAYQKRAFSALFAYPPESRNIAGYNITMYETDFGPIGVMYEPHIPVDTILFVSLAVVKPVFNEVPGKGLLFYEPKAQVAASEGGMLYGHIGLDYGPEWLHGKITNLKSTD